MAFPVRHICSHVIVFYLVGQVLEAWNIALSVGFVGMRIVKVLLVSLFFIARIDTP